MTASDKMPKASNTHMASLRQLLRGAGRCGCWAAGCCHADREHCAAFMPVTVQHTVTASTNLTMIVVCDVMRVLGSVSQAEPVLLLWVQIKGL